VDKGYGEDLVSTQDMALEMMPWRKEGRHYGNLVRVVMQRFFSNVRMRDWWNPNCRKFADTEYTLNMLGD